MAKVGGNTISTDCRVAFHEIDLIQSIGPEASDPIGPNILAQLLLFPFTDTLLVHWTDVPL
jgi:hypothetical protein